MIIFDTETTGLVEPEGTPLDSQPQIIEFGAVKVDDAFKVVDKINFLINPGRKLPPIITKITGIKDEDLKDQKSFAHHYPELCDFFLGETQLLAHNVTFDVSLLRFELERIGKVRNFPWPKEHLCSIELAHHLENRSLKMEYLYELAFKRKANQTHRALDDVMQLHEIVIWMSEQGIL